MKTILWLYSKPLNPEVGGMERITSLVQRGLKQAGYNCLDILVLDRKGKGVSYQNAEVDVYQFLKDNKVDVVINQWGQLPEYLKCFFYRGGKRWHEEGGRIISCLHFSPVPSSLLYNSISKEKKTLKDYYVIAKAWLFFDKFAKEDQMRQGRALREVYDNSDAYVMLSESYRQYVIEAMGIEDDSKLIAINNPLTFDEISDEAILDKKHNTILVVSRMYEWHKRISLILRIWERLTKKASMWDWELKIVGDGPDMERYREYVAKHAIKRISFEGQQSPEPYYCEAKIFLMTSKTEGWGQTITEAQQRGVVPIAFGTSSAFYDMITDGENGYIVKEGAIRQYVKKIEMLANDEALWRQMAKNALTSAKRFSLDKITEQWVRVIN